MLPAYPTTINYVIGDTVSVRANIDPLYGFSNWASDSNMIMPQNTSENMSFYASKIRSKLESENPTFTPPEIDEEMKKLGVL